jgi:hypothetical protein
VETDQVALALENGAIEVVVKQIARDAAEEAKALTWSCKNTGMAEPK